MQYHNIIAEKHGRVLLLKINREEALNALNGAIMKEMAHAVKMADADSDVAIIIITGAGRAFAAGADIKEMAPQSFSDMYMADYFTGWDEFANSRKPKIAAVNGFALGGGCELAMMCDMIIASDKAKFGQPEIKLGVTPGMGGSIRLTKIVGKAIAMDMILTGRMIDAEEALKIGLISRILPNENFLEEALKIGTEIASYSQISLIAAKEMVNQALEVSTKDGVKFERRLFMALFSTEDQKEGMAAFSEKRSPIFKGK